MPGPTPAGAPSAATADARPGGIAAPTASHTTTTITASSGQEAGLSGAAGAGNGTEMATATGDGAAAAAAEQEPADEGITLRLGASVGVDSRADEVPAGEGSAVDAGIAAAAAVAADAAGAAGAAAAAAGPELVKADAGDGKQQQQQQQQQQPSTDQQQHEQQGQQQQQQQPFELEQQGLGWDMVGSAPGPWEHQVCARGCSN